jgi:hypothetical protein
MGISMDIKSASWSSPTAELLVKDVNELIGEDASVGAVCGPIVLGNAT